ncbi:MAG: rhomboid family protein [Steroidobacteraceae bacterium]|jgi:membrane associated rhomboid family serine protease|nr:rhomboid family protein [Steroidobacteraceae bacterium]
MTPAVLALIVANVAIYFLQVNADPALVAQFQLWPLGKFFHPAFGGYVGFEPWQLVTSAFLHDPRSIAHLLLNMFALFMFGRDVEAAMGTRRFVWLYGASVLAGSLAQLVVVTATIDQGVGPTVGASGGVFGVLLAFAVMFPKRRMIVFPIPVPMPAWVAVTGFAVIELVSGVYRTQSGVAHFAHLGGMVGAAIVLLWLSRRRGPPRAPSV